MSATIEGAAGDLRVLGPLGFGTRGTLWSAMTADGERVAVRLLAERPADDPGAARRLRALTGVRSDHVASVLEVREVPGGTLLVSRIVPGPTLATVRAGTAGLGRAECLRLLADVCAGLAALHRGGLVHGDVAPANVVLTPVVDPGTPPDADAAEGRATRPVLVDLGGLGAWEDGTAGFRAPELRAGAPASAASDVWSAARLAVWAVAEHERAQLSAELAGALADDPARRPTALALAGLVGGRAAAAIEIPDRASLARARLREQAQRDPTRLARGHRSRRTRRRRERRRRRTLLVALAPVLLAAAVTAGALLPLGPAARSTSAPLTLETAPGDAVHTLTAWRDAALNDGDAGALLRLSVPGSPAAGADAELAAGLAGEHPEGLTTTVEIVAVGGSAAQPRVRTLLGQSGHGRVAVGGDRWTVRAGGPRCVEITLGAFKDRWRVAAVESCPVTP